MNPAGSFAQPAVGAPFTPETVTNTVALLDPKEVEMAADPAATAVTTPAALTVATALLLDLQTRLASLTKLPGAPLTVGRKACEVPRASASVGGENADNNRRLGSSNVARTHHSGQQEEELG